MSRKQNVCLSNQLCLCKGHLFYSAATRCEEWFSTDVPCHPVQVPVWRALLTRAHGPGMVAPTVTDAEPAARADVPGPAVQPQAAIQPVQPPAQPAGQPAVAPLYPWERRPLGALDWYAAAAFFLVTLPGSLAVLSAAGEGALRCAPASVQCCSSIRCCCLVD